MQIHEALLKVLYVMKWSLGVPSVMLGRSNSSDFHVYWACTQFRLLFAVCLVVYLNKPNIDNDIFVSQSWILLTHFCVAVKLFWITHNRDQPPLKSTLYQLQVYANIRSLKISKWEMCIQLVLDLILDKDKYKLSLEFDAILGGLSIGQLRTCPVF